jgi:hypothetical protein
MSTPELVVPTDEGTLFRCARCGIESRERTCFIIPERYGKPPRDVRCLTCEQRRTAPTSARATAGFVLALFWPVFILAGSQRGTLHTIPVWAVLVTALVYPVAIVLHEAGHALTASLLQLEIGGVGIGYGRVLWRFQLGGLPIQIHAWPLSGRVYLGSRSMRFLRTRLWVSTLLGPTTNIACATLAAHYWVVLEPFAGGTVLGIWLIVNVLLVLASLVPRRGTEFGQQYRSDGRALLEIPYAKTDSLAPYMTAAPLVRSWFRYQSDDFSGAKEPAKEALARNPRDMVAHLMLVSSLINLEEYDVAASQLALIVETLEPEQPAIRAAVWNALAVTLVLGAARNEPDLPDLRRAERLSIGAYDAYPCVLEYRSTLALVRVATGNPAKALALLEYQHYETGTPRQRGHRETARAFAFGRLGRTAEAAHSAAMAIDLDPMNARILRTLGVP